MNIDNFTNRAEAYAKGRPGYTNECIEKIGLPTYNPRMTVSYREKKAMRNTLQL